jgi:magnesium transporter
MAEYLNNFIGIPPYYLCQMKIVLVNNLQIKTLHQSRIMEKRKGIIALSTKAAKAEIKKCISERKWNDLRELLIRWPPATVADLIQETEKRDCIFIFRSLPRKFAADVFSEMDVAAQNTLLKSLTDSEAAELLAELTPDDRTALFEELPAQVTRRLFELLNPEDLKEARQLLGYPEDSVGRLMTPDFMAVRADWTVKNALKYIREKDETARHLRWYT